MKKHNKEIIRKNEFKKNFYFLTFKFPTEYFNLYNYFDSENIGHITKS